MTDSLPNFMIVGAAKSGTTSLFDYLNQHHQVFLPSIKETKFFTQRTYAGPGSERLNSRIIKSQEEYNQLYQFDDLTIRAVGDISPDYLYHHDEVVPRLIKEFGQKLKIIIILRNPVERAFSAYMHKVRDLLETETFKEAMDQEESRIRDNYEFLWFYKKAGLYYDAVKHYKEDFSDVRVYLFEELRDTPTKVMTDICEFLDIATDFEFQLSVKNFSGKPRNLILQKFLRSNSPIKEFVLSVFPKSLRTRIKNKLQKGNLEKIQMGIEERQDLLKYYDQDIVNLQNLIGKDLSQWRK